MDWHLLSHDEVGRHLGSGPSGLDSPSAEERIQKYGRNEIEDKKKKTLWQLALRQFADLMILILAAAALISGLLGDLTDTIVILSIVLLNAAVGFIQEYNAEKAIEALRKMSTSSAVVIRDGEKVELLSSDVVPGDVILLEAGNIIPADIRFIETHQFKVDESALTGESVNVEKNTKILSKDNHPLGERFNMGFKGTHVTHGRATAYVVATGMKTELGRIAGMIQSGEGITPLQKRLTSFSKRLSVIILIICAAFFLIGWLRGQAVIDILLVSISLAVAAIPEALPALVTIALAFGAKRLVKNKALIRQLHAVETLGSVTYICSDKTGTLTLNKMTVEEIFEINNNPYGDVFGERGVLLHAMALNNDVRIDKEGQYIGDSTEVALVQYAALKHVEKIKAEEAFHRLAEIPFDSTRKCMSTIHQTNGGFIVITKGAVDALIHLLHAEGQVAIANFEKKAEEMASRGYRVLGYAMKKIKTIPQDLDTKEVESSLTFIGFAGMIDPPREEAKKAVSLCKEAGIIPVMITGDHKLTAIAIAKKLGIISSNSDLALTGNELETLTTPEFEDQVEKIRVYARVNPEQKLKIIKGLQDKNHFVAMTGDGVNDAPALKNADIGIAMGINGTEVSKEASNMILLDDNFATIVKAVEHGRRIFDNILKFIKYIMTGNSGELWAILLAPFFGLPIPLIPIQILWVNLISDGLPGLALASEPAEDNIMRRPPYRPDRSVFAGGLGVHILWVGFLIGMTTIGLQAWAIYHENDHWQTMAFTALCFSQLMHVMAIRTQQPFFRAGLMRNRLMFAALILTFALQLMIIYTPFFNTVFKTHPLALNELLITLAVSSIIFVAVEIEKWIMRISARPIPLKVQ